MRFRSNTSFEQPLPLRSVKDLMTPKKKVKG
jgi:hypothetical protein